MGDFVYVRNIPNDCICKCCWKVYRRPVGFKECRHVFCESCAARMVAFERHCHTCAMPLSYESVIECMYTDVFILLSKVIYNIGTEEVQQNMQQLWVGCRKVTCAWRGKLSEYRSHQCPYEPYSFCDKTVLQELYCYDERIYVKVKVMEEVARRMLKENPSSVDVGYLRLAYVYMTRYRTCQEIQHVGLDILIRVSEICGGVQLMLNHCHKIRYFLSSLESNPFLKQRAEMLSGLLSIPDGVSAVSMLSRLSK